MKKYIVLGFTCLIFIGGLFEVIRTNAEHALLALVKKENPRSALEQLKQDMEKNETLLRSCHFLVHEIGHAAYKKYKDFSKALQYKSEICNSGYLHGVIESFFLESKDLFATMKSVCQPYRQGSFLSWECYHGVGHGLMYYTENDLPKSLIMCDSYEDPFAQTTCSNGIFMENFNTDQKLHPSRYLSPEHPFLPCSQQEQRHKADCYLYAPTYFLSLHKNNYAGALRACEEVEVTYRPFCARGVGSQTIKENIKKPKMVEEICMGATTENIAPCIGGMIDFYINHHGSLEPAGKLCETLEPSNQSVCREGLKASSPLFREEST